MLWYLDPQHLQLGAVDLPLGPQNSYVAFVLDGHCPAASIRPWDPFVDLFMYVLAVSD